MYLHILEEDADNSTELMPEECTYSSHDKKQLAVKVFYKHILIWWKSRDRLLSLSNHVDG